MKAVVLAAGEGSRMRPLSRTRPKVLIPVAGRPILDHVVDGLREAGVTEFLLIVQYLGEMVEEWARGARARGLAVETLLQPAEPYGTGAAALAAADWAAGEPVLLQFGDILCDRANLPRLGQLIREHPSETMLTAYRMSALGGGAVFWSDGRLERLVEKPTAEEAEGAGVFAGIALLRPEDFEILRTAPLSPRGELEVTDVFLTRLREGTPPLVHELTGYWSNVSDGAEVLRLNRIHAAGGEAAVVLMDGATVDAPASLSDTMLLEGARIGAESHATFAVLGAGATVGARCRLEGTAEAPVMLGDGARLGDDCILGPGTRLAPGGAAG